MHPCFRQQGKPPDQGHDTTEWGALEGLLPGCSRGGSAAAHAAPACMHRTTSTRGGHPPAGFGPARLRPTNLYSDAAIRSRRLPARTAFFPATRRAAALAALAALGLAACGRYGPLEPPPDASAPAKPAAPAANASTADALNPQLKQKIPPIVPPKSAFHSRSAAEITPRCITFPIAAACFAPRTSPCRRSRARSARRSTAIRAPPSSGISRCSAPPSPARTRSSATR